MMFPRREEIIDVITHVPHINEDLREIIINAIQAKKVPTLKEFYHHKLRLDIPEDRALMTKYMEMSTYVEDLSRLMEVVPSKADSFSRIIRVIDKQSRHETMESLEQYDKILQLARTFYINAIPYTFKFDTLEQILTHPLSNYLLQKTFRPTLEYTTGVDIKKPNTYEFSPEEYEKEPEEISNELQKEIAGLNQKFRVLMDPARTKGTIRLECYLEFALLPAVPPIYVLIPENYPNCSPICEINQHDYSTPLLNCVQNILTRYISELPECYSLSRLLDCWDIALRKASFQNRPLDNFDMIYDMLTK